MYYMKDAPPIIFGSSEPVINVTDDDKMYC
jgi:hypothetical protein